MAREPLIKINTMAKTVQNDSFFTLCPPPGHVQCYPLANIYIEDGVYVMDLLTPGVDSKNIEVKATTGEVTVLIKGNSWNKKVKWLKHEFNYNVFSHCYKIPGRFDTGSMEETYCNGILSLRIPARKSKSK